MGTTRLTDGIPDCSICVLAAFRTSWLPSGLPPSPGFASLPPRDTRWLDLCPRGLSNLLVTLGGAGGGHRSEADVGGGVFFWVWLLEQASPITLKVDHKGAHNVDCVDLGQLREAVRLLS